MPNKHLPLILIPGIMCTKKLWYKQIQSLSSVTKITIPNIAKEASIEDFAKEILSSLRVKVNVVGFSFGGYIAQEMVKQAPHKVSKLILMNTCGGEFSKKQQQTRYEFIDLCQKSGAKFALNVFLDKINSSYYNNKDVVPIISEMVKETNENIFARQFKSVYNYNLNPPSLLNIRCETLIISSTDDPFISKEACEELANTIPKNKIKILEGGGHMLPLSKPDEINSLMKDFFRYYSV